MALTDQSHFKLCHQKCCQMLLSPIKIYYLSYSAVGVTVWYNLVLESIRRHLDLLKLP